VLACFFVYFCLEATVAMRRRAHDEG
jgi:hypothetical protein